MGATHAILELDGSIILLSMHIFSLRYCACFLAPAALPLPVDTMPSAYVTYAGSLVAVSYIRSDVRGAGTDAAVSIELHGTKVR